MSVAVCPEQIVVLPVAVAMGGGEMVTVTESTPVQPLASLTFTV